MDKIDSLSDAERQRCEVWTRVMGYHRPVSEFNPGKQSEHAQRQHFREPATSERIATKVSAQWKPCA
ncbi:hypothetical protein BI364_05110 [Acidihalobacter yilgarnensis]|uniref:Oxidoreductase n=1 Tax=Acidihalobacter yilgarnensis TaxID=2819280 RepID=A0A1D8ISS0_9GAMM|nr:hypothetical protein BI364_05110 [Acidihalobacter yilgarnensis]